MCQQKKRGTLVVKKNKSYKKALLVLAIIMAIIAAITICFDFAKKDGNNSPTEYHEIIGLFKDGRVTEYNLNLENSKLEYYIEGSDNPYTYTVPDNDLFIADSREAIKSYSDLTGMEYVVKADYISASSISKILMLAPSVMLFAFITGMSFFLIKKTKKLFKETDGKPQSAIHLSKDIENTNKIKTKFADVAGADEEKEELTEIVEFLKYPEKFSKLGAQIPKGVLLSGPPGTGKTLLARAVAGEANVPFFSISGSDFVELYVGVGASRVRDLFDKAKKAAPSIIFIDEIDTVGRKRGTSVGGGNDEREQTLNQLLVEMDGFSGNSGVIVIAATNRPDVLDPALLRPGRFDRQITVGYPDAKGRLELLKVYAKNKPLSSDVNLKDISLSTIGFTGADIKNLLNEAALIATRKTKSKICSDDIDEAILKILVGTEKKSRKMSEAEKKLTAYHEAGHAVVSYYLDNQDPVEQISIIPRGFAGGYTLQRPVEETTYSSKKKMLESLVTLLGGRVAEELFLGDISTGASNDLQRATAIATNMVTRYGMSEALGPVTFFSNDTSDYVERRNCFSESVSEKIDSEIQKIISEAKDKTTALLTEHSDKVKLVADRLMIQEKIDGIEFELLMSMPVAA